MTAPTASPASRPDPTRPDATPPGQPTGESPRQWHALPVADALTLLAVDPDRGLAASDAEARLRRSGPNRVGQDGGPSLVRLALAQFRSLVVLLLLAAAGVAATLGEHLEAVAILAALLANAAIGLTTEWRARISLDRLRALAVPEAVVRRDGRHAQIEAALIVPGDVLVLQAGAHIPADARLVQASRLRTDESALTGESAPVDKDALAGVAPDAPLAERSTMVYLGTTVVAGRGLAVVTATGAQTELGRIGRLVALAGERATPLERQVEELGHRLIVVALATCGAVGVAGILRGQPTGLMLETAISLAIAAIPEGLPAITTVALAAGLWRLARAGALVRRLPAVEALGSTTCICADKTGTMTENRMTATRLYVAGRTVAVGAGPAPSSRVFTEAGIPIDPLGDPQVVRLLTAGALVNDATVIPGEGPSFQGDPTEVALLAVAVAAGLDPPALARQWPRRHEVPFDPVLRLMATFHEAGPGRDLCVKGAPAAVLAAASQQETPDGPRPLTDEDRRTLLDVNRTLAQDGLRVLAIAWRPKGDPRDTDLGRLTFLGFVALEDPVRPGVREAIAHCARAGIRTLMLTGDQRSTAESVGRQLGLAPETIRSRVSPQDKLDLVAALQAEGQVVAMTGDGVNDAPALARADIGVAMGRHGTDVARDAADIVLTDDDFTTITRAIEEGRVIYANLRKVIRFLFTCNLSEILTIFVAILLGLPSPLLPLQILWVNLVTDILPAVGLIHDPPEPDVMARPPRDPRDALVTWRLGWRLVAEGVLLSAGVLTAYLWVVSREGPGPHATTVAFVALVLLHPFQALHCRSDRRGWWRLPPNRLSWGALAALAGIQWVAVTWHPLTALLGTVALSAADWTILTLAVLWPVLVLEAVKTTGARRR